MNILKGILLLLLLSIVLLFDVKVTARPIAHATRPDSEGFIKGIIRYIFRGRAFIMKAVFHFIKVY